LACLGPRSSGPLILSRGSAADKERYIQPILSAEEIWCQGFSEPDHGSDLGSVQTRAVFCWQELILMPVTNTLA